MQIKFYKGYSGNKFFENMEPCKIIWLNSKLFSIRITWDKAHYV
jgi:hypothetical protein